ncbi:MAG: hypothetical protein WBA10_18985 [Elainellaceae cyanobacterium]
MNRLRFSQVGGWLKCRHSQVLDNAYIAAQKIKDLENEYCGGRPITDEATLGRAVYDYVRSLCDRELLKVRNNLAQFKLNSFLLGRPLVSADDADRQAAHETEQDSLGRSPDTLPIDGVPKKPRGHASAAQITDPALAQIEMTATELSRPGLLGGFSLNRKQTEQYEKQVVLEMRQWRRQSRTALRWIAILLIAPILIGVLAKSLLFGPLLGNYGDKNPTAVQLSEEIQAEFAANLTAFKEEIEIRELLKLTPELATAIKQEKLAEKASELWREARNEELNGLKNVLSDGVATLIFVGLVYFNRRRLTVIRTFSNRAFLSLSDPIKIFLFILVTDIFVGFHSAEGWDAILTWLSHHFGLPERPNAINLFIATVPVMMDSFIKFWIFNYLTRFSPSSSAIFERMNS